MTCSAARKGRSRRDRGLGDRPRSPRARELVAEVRREAFPLFDWATLGGRDDLIPTRPQKRGDCEPCPVCQAFLDRVRELDVETQHHPGAHSGPASTLERLHCGHRAGEALNHCRPCARVSCKHHLYLEVENGHVRYVFPDREVDQLRETCVLDVADRGGADAGGITWGQASAGGVGWDETAALLNLTSEGMRLLKQGLKATLLERARDQEEDDE